MRFATFAHAMSSTSATAPSSISIQARTLPTRCSCSGITRVLIPGAHFGYCRSIDSATLFIRSFAWLNDTPLFRRPTTVQLKLRLSPRTLSACLNKAGE
jgi:hypothetical protein